MLDRKCFIVVMIGIGLSVSPVVTHAQSTTQLPQVIAKLSIADFVNPFQPSINTGIEHQWKGRWYWHHQAAFLFKIPYESDFSYPDQTGLRLRSGLRLYTKKSSEWANKVFWELNIGYLRAKMLLEDDFFRFAGYYKQRITYARWQELYTATIEGGTAQYLSSHWIMEFGVSGGVQFGNIHYSEIPSDARLTGQGFTAFTYKENPRVSSIHFGLRLKVGYVLK